MSANKSGCGCGGGATAMVKSRGAAVAKKGCGCGKSNCGCGTKSCGCGAKSCSTCNSDGFVRPLFFAGQLLTEDDLQAIVDYVVGKNRLHNRMLFGEGVVCGLEVTCDPCDCSKLIVRPGYALDCCGNDIVVPCPVTLDVKQLVRELKAKLLGSDCGDPCAPKPTTPPTTGNGNPVIMEQAAPAKSHAQRYCLYVKYCEQPIDPVAPYATDDCSPSSCQPSRLQEGFVFELRCTEDDVEPPTLAGRLRDCFGDDEELQLRRLEEATLLMAIFAPLKRALPLALAQKTPPVPEHHFVATIEEQLSATVRELATPAAIPDLVKATQKLLQLATLEAQSLVAAHERTRAAKRGSAAADPVQTLATELATHLPSPLPETFAARFVGDTINYFKTDALATIYKRDATAVRALANGAAIVPELLLATEEPLQRMYDLLARDVARPNTTVCGVNQKLQSYTPPSLGYQEGTFNYSLLVQAVPRIEWLASSTVRVLQECLCNAFNPPCNDCDDDGVLLACFTWCDCCVDGICNLERDFVLTGPNIRYWVPAIDQFFERLEQCCCPDDCGDQAAMIERWGCMEELLRGARSDGNGTARMLLGHLATPRMPVIVPATTTLEPSLTVVRPPELTALREEVTALRELYNELHKSNAELKAQLKAAKR